MVVPQNRISIQVSVDSGTKSTYQSVKGHDMFDKVWRNISKYSEVNSSAIIIKYIILNKNSSDNEFYKFIDLCCINKIKKVKVSTDHLALWKGEYSDTLVARMGVLAKKLKSKGIYVERVDGGLSKVQQQIFIDNAGFVTMKERFYNSPFRNPAQVVYRFAKRILMK